MNTPSRSILPRRTCPNCSRGTTRFPAASYCPHCGTLLPTSLVHAMGLTALPAAPLREHPLQWARLIACRLRGVSNASAYPPATVIAYVNALVHLGDRYQNAGMHDQNLQQAYRYFEKAARMGNVPAKARMAAMMPDPVPDSATPV